MHVRRVIVLFGSVLAGALLPLIPAASPAGAAPTQQWSVQVSGWDRTSSPAIADIDGNGINDVVVGHQDGYVRVMKDGTSATVPGWPQPAIVAGSTPTAIDSSPAVADLDHNGSKEIVVGVGSTWVAHQPGGIVVFNPNGSVRCRWTGVDNMNVWTMDPHPDGYPEGVYSTPAIGDVDGDGYPDIVFGGWDAYIHVLNNNCQETVAKYFNDDTIWSSPVLYDVDGDGRQEIFIGGDSHSGGTMNWPGGVIRSLKVVNGAIQQRWVQKVNEVVDSSIALADIDGDGRPEVVNGTGQFYNGSDQNKVFAWHADNGSLVAGWPQATGGITWASPVVADVNGDGRPEVIEGSRDGKLWVWRGNGSLLWSVDPGAQTGNPSAAISSSAMVGDVTGDGRPEVVITSAWGTFILDGATGHAVGGPLIAGQSGDASAALGDFGPNGWRLITANYNTPSKYTLWKAFSVPKPGAAVQWPMWRKNARRLGTDPSDGTPLPPGYCRQNVNPPAAPSAASAKGYWFLGRDGGIFSFDAPFFGSLPGLGIRTQVLNMAATRDGGGYWILANDGGVFSFGDARFFGSMGGKPLNGRIIAMVPTPDSGGYWLLGSDGGIFSFGDAHFYGSMGGKPLNAPIIGMAPTNTGHGYWLLSSDGGIFSFGDAHFSGSMGGKPLAAPVISMSASPTGGYWLLGGDGGVFSFGTPFWGSIPGVGLCGSPTGVQLRASSTGKGYWILSADGGVFSFGDAAFHGSYPGLPADRAAIDMAIRH